MLLAGCSAETETDTGDERAEPAPTVEEKKAKPREPVRGEPFPLPAGAQRARVRSVTDGDTVDLSGIGRVRLIGVDTPEIYGGSECFGAAASAFTKRVLKPRTRVRYTVGTGARDRYGRALVYVWLRDGTSFNRLLAARGYATPLTVAPNVEHAAVFVAAARRARERGRGLWSDKLCAGENRASLSPPPAPAPSKSGCGRFRDRASAQRWFERNGGRPGRNVAGMDGDGDGEACESLS